MFLSILFVFLGGFIVSIEISIGLKEIQFTKLQSISKYWFNIHMDPFTGSRQEYYILPFDFLSVSMR